MQRELTRCIGFKEVFFIVAKIFLIILMEYCHLMVRKRAELPVKTHKILEEPMLEAGSANFEIARKEYK